MSADTEALLATVREALLLIADNGWRERAEAREAASTALDSLTAELERTQKIAEAHKNANKLLVDEYEAKLTAHVESMQAAEDELERERHANELLGSANETLAARNAELVAELERLRGYEREIENLRDELRHYAGPKVEANVRRT